MQICFNFLLSLRQHQFTLLYRLFITYSSPLEAYVEPNLIKKTLKSTFQVKVNILRPITKLLYEKLE